MMSWQHGNPEFDYLRIDDAAAQAFLESQGMRGVLLAYRRAREPAQRADLIRLAYLLVYGGFYADADDRCLAPLGSFVPSNAAFAAYHEDFGTLGNNFLGVSPNHPVIRLALKLGTEAVNRGDTDFLWLATGPGLITRAFAYLASQPNVDISRDLGAIIFDMGFLARHVGFHCEVRYKKTAKHWSRSSFISQKR
jgi:mannosyltransferase OCH1-like enzyme